jgi:hypothetical protein
MASRPVMRKIRIIGIFFENSLQWQFEVEKKISTNSCFRLHICLRTNKTLIRNFLYVLDNSRGEILAIKWYCTVRVWKCLQEGRSRSGKLAIRITSARISGVLLCSFRVMLLKFTLFLMLTAGCSHTCGDFYRLNQTSFFNVPYSWHVFYHGSISRGIIILTVKHVIYCMANLGCRPKKWGRLQNLVCSHCNIPN